MKTGNTQLVFLSATFPEKLINLAEKFLMTPTGVSYNRVRLLTAGRPGHEYVTQLYSNCYGDRDKVDFLKFLLENSGIAGQMLFFCEKK